VLLRSHSPTLRITQGYWILYPPGFQDESKKFPIIYALHGNNGHLGDIFKEIDLPSFWQYNEHQLIFELGGAGMYFPFIAYCMMNSESVNQLREELQALLTAVAGDNEKNTVNEVVEPIIYYLPEDADSWLPDLTEMILVFPDADNSWYANRLGPPEGRNAEGLGAEPSFPISEATSPAGRIRPHMTGWYERYMIQDVFQEIERNVIGLDRLVAEEQRRFIMGVSMGGYGSLVLAMRNPAKFVAVASLGAAANTTSEIISPDGIYMKNLLFPEQIDVFGSAPLPVNASKEEVIAHIQLDEAYVSAHNPFDLVESMEGTHLHFFVEIGENDISQTINPGSIEHLQEFIERLREKGVPVKGGIVPAASAGEPPNGDANHLQGFFRVRFGHVLKYFSEVYSDLGD